MKRSRQYTVPRIRRHATAAAIAILAVATVAGCSTGAPEDEPETIEFPTRPIDVVIPFDPGGGTDVFARLLIEQINEGGELTLRPQNVPGAGGAIGTREVVEAEADGYTLCFCTQGTLITASLRDEVGYTWEDVDPVAIVSEPSSAIAVGPDSPYGSIEDLLDAARENPGEVTMGTGGPSGQLAQAILELALDVEFRNVPFDGSSEVLQGVAGGHVDAALASTGGVRSMNDSGLVTVLATTGSEEEIDGVPPVSEQADDAVAVIWYGLLAPNGVPDEVLEIIRDAVVEAAENEDFAARMADAGTPVRLTTDGDEIRDRFAAEVDQLGPAIERTVETM